MKSFILASAVTLSASAVQADDTIPNLNLPEIGVGGELEYSIENSELAMEVGPDISLGDINLSSRLQAIATDEISVDFTGIEVEGSYSIIPAVDLYSTISTTDELKYDDVKIGVRFSF